MGNGRLLGGAEARRCLACVSVLSGRAIQGRSSLVRDAIDRRRSITLAHFAEFAALEGVSFVSLQKGEAASQTKAPPAGLTIHDWTDELNDLPIPRPLWTHSTS